MKHAIANDRGTAAVEAVLSLFAFVGLVALVLTGLYLSFVLVWLNRQAYEATVCLASTADRGYCDQRLREQSALPLGAGLLTLNNFSVHRTPHSARASFDVHLPFVNGPIHVIESRRLPLTGE